MRLIDPEELDDYEIFDESIGFDFVVGELVEVISYGPQTGVIISAAEDEIIRVKCDDESGDHVKQAYIKKALYGVYLTDGTVIEEYGEYIRRI